MSILVEKNKYLNVSKVSIRCKLAINNKIINNTSWFCYLRVDIASFGNFYRVTTTEAEKSTVIAKALKDII